MMLSSPKEADINDFANRTSRLVPSTAESIKHAKETLSSLLLTLSGNLDLNTPLLTTLLNYPIGIDWNATLEHFIDIHRIPRPNNLKRFLVYRWYRPGAIIIPDSNPTQCFVLEGYIKHTSKVRYSIKEVLILDNGDYQYPSIGKELEKNKLAYKADIQGRLFRSEDQLKRDIEGERKRFRKKMVKILTIFASKVLEGL